MIQFLLPAIGGLASLGGIAMQNKGAAAQQRAVNATKRAAFDRERASRNEANALSQQAIDEVRTVPNAVEDNRSHLRDAFMKSGQKAEDEGKYAFGSAAGALDSALRAKGVSDDITKRSHAMGDLGSFGATFSDLNRSAIRRATDMNGIQSQARRDASITPLELQAAMLKGQDKVAMGQILSALGQTGMSIGMGGFGGFGGGDALTTALGNAGAPVGLGRSNGGALVSSILRRFNM